jgi:chlorophyllide a reductase subunit X
MAQRTIAIYGKGGIGKSFTTTNLSATFALMNKKVLQLGCDPKHDSTTSLFGGISLPTVTEVFAEKNSRNEQVSVSDIVFRRSVPGFPQPIYGIELGGPQVGRGCGGRGIISGFDVLEKLGIFRWNIDIILMDFLGDVVCGGFATPLARSLSEEVILVTSNDRQSIFTANNICQANNYFRTVGGRSRLLGLIINRDDGTGMAEKYAEAAGITVLMKIPHNTRARDLDDSFDFAVRIPEIGHQFEKLATEILNGSIRPCEAKGLDFQQFVRLFGEVNEEIPAPATAEELFPASRNDIAPAPESGKKEVFGEQPLPALNSHSSVHARDDRSKLLDCIGKLPDGEREMYTLFEMEKKSVEEIALMKKLHVSEVLDLIAKAQTELRRLFFQQ